MITSPNQKIITVQKEAVNKDKPYIVASIENIENASKELKSHIAFKLFIYFTGNQNNYRFGFSPRDFAERYGVSEQSARNGLKELIEAGYVVQDSGNRFIFRDRIVNFNIVAAEEERKAFIDDETGERFELTFKELVATIGSEEEAKLVWGGAK